MRKTFVENAVNICSGITSKKCYFNQENVLPTINRTYFLFTLIFLSVLELITLTKCLLNLIFICFADGVIIFN